MDTLLHTYRSDEDDEEIPTSNPNRVHSHPAQTHIVSDPVQNLVTNIQMDSHPVERTQVVSDPVHNQITNTQMESDHGEKTQVVSDPVHDQITNTLMESIHGEKAQVEPDPVHDQITNTQLESDHGEKTQVESDPVHNQPTETHTVSDPVQNLITNTQMDSDPGDMARLKSDLVHNQLTETQIVSDPVLNIITNIQMESDLVENIQMESDPVYNQPTETHMVSDRVHNLMTNTQMDSDPGEKTQMEPDPVNNQIIDTQMESHPVEETRMEIDPVDDKTTRPMLAESAEPEAVEDAELEPKAKNKPEVQSEPELMVVELGENVGGETLTKVESLGSEEVSTDSISDYEQNPESSDKKSVGNGDEESSDQNPPKKQKSLSQMEIETTTPVANKSAMSSGGSKKKSSKKKSKNNNVWTKPTSRKGKKKTKNNNQSTPKTPQDMVYVAPIPRFPDRNDDSPDAKICLSKFYKAEKVEISEDRLSASSCKGYRMVRATRGVTEGAWYFEIKVVYLGETGHTRLGWSNEKGDLQAPVGYDANSFGYRDIDGSKIHKALREKYGDEGYKEGDVIGFYINLPQGNLYAPKPAHMVWYKGQKFAYAPDTKNDPQIVPGSEILFFKNGVCQGVAYKDLCGGCYYPAASMYTLPNQPNCTVKFNFGPDFECFPTDFEGRPSPSPMIQVPYHGFDNRVENGVVDETKV